MRLAGIIRLRVTGPRPEASTFGVLLGVNVALAAVSFLTTMVAANHLGRDIFGEFNYALAVGGYCVTFVYCGLEQTLVRDLVQNPDRFTAFASASLILRAALLSVSFLGILAFNAATGPEGQLPAAGLLIVLCEGVKGLYLTQVYDAWRSMTRHVLYQFAERTVYFAGLWAIIAFKRDWFTFLAIAWLMATSTALGLVLQYRWALPRLALRFDRESAALAARMLRGNLWVWSAVLATLSFGVLSKIVLRHLSGSGELGGYSVAWQVVLLGSLLMAQVARIGYPYLAELARPGEDLRRRLGFLSRYAAVSTFAGASVGLPAMLCPSLLLKVFRPEYAGSAGAVRILGGYVILNGLGQVAVQYLISVRKEKFYSFVIILSGMASLLLNVLLIPRWAGEGAALAVALSHGAAFAIFSWAAFRHAVSREKADSSGEAHERQLAETREART